MKLPAVAPDFYGRIGPSPTNLTEDRFIKAVEFRERRVHADKGGAERKAGDLNYFMVHHAVIGASAGRSGTEEAEHRSSHRDDGRRQPRGRAFQRRLGAWPERDHLSGRPGRQAAGGLGAELRSPHPLDRDRSDVRD